MRLPRNVLLTTCGALTLLSYYLLVFTQWGNYYHGGGPVDKVLLDAFIVLAAFSCLEVVRTERVTALRVLCSLLGLPLAFFALVSLWYGVKAYIAG